MDDFIGFIVAVVLMGLAVLGAVFLVTGSTDSSIVNACDKNGYWQTGQTRVICHVEKKGG